MAKVQAIIAAAGIGERLGFDKPKPLVEIKGRPIIAHTLDVFERCFSVNSIILVVNPEHVKEFESVVRNGDFKKAINIVPGGEKRTDSVLSGLSVVDEDTDIVVIHDGARPIISEDIIARTVDACKKEGAVIVAVPVKQTIKRVDVDDMSVECTLDRLKIWEVQTPQVFKKDILKKAYKESDLDNATDDAFLVEHTGQRVAIIKGEYSNIKITTKEDLLIAEKLLG